ncbi:MAG: hypothetical protein PHO41_06610, partial [Eubacteriales bacterium]|nr:hypothetical protein [Eubacteriales bacterium]
MNGFAEECYKSSADELWYVTECERFAALSFRFTASTMGMATIYTPEGQVVSAISAGEETSIGCIAEEAGVYYIRVSGGEGTYTLALEKKEPIRVSYNIHRELLDGSLLSIPEYKEEYQVTLQNSTTGQPITGSVYTGEEILVVPDQANAGDTLQAQIKHLNGKTADATAQCQVTASNTAAFDARVLPKGRYMVLCENTQDACAYLFREDGSYQETLERLDEGFTSSSLDAGSYTVVLIQGGQGLYKFPTLAQYGKSGLTAGTDYLLKEIRIQDGSDTQDSIELIPDAPKATHPALNGEACAYKVSAAEAVSGAMVAAKLEYAFQDTAGVIGNIQARIQLGAGTVYVEKSAAANGVAVNAVLEGDTLVIPLSETSGTVCFYVTPNDGEASMVSAARLAFTVNGEKNDALIGSASVKITNLSLHAPQYAASDKVLLWGNGNAGEEISILDNGIEAGKALCDKAGFWSQTVTLQKDAKAGIHSLYATSNGVNSVASTLRIADAAPSVVNFTLYYMYHDSMQKMEIPGEILGTAPVRFDYMPGTDLTFSLHMTQNEKIDRLFVNAEMDGEVRTLEAFYDASAARWDATGRFGDEMSFVPGTFTISYTKKKAEEGEAADTAETETSADSGEAEPIFTDASVALLSSEEYEDRIGWEAQLMITLTGKATANIPAEYSDELVYLQNARKYLEDNGFQSAGENENGQEMYIRCWATEDSAETEIATLLPAVTSVGTAKQYFTLLSAALENGGYDPELDAYGITEAAFDELLQNRDTVLADVDYAQNVVKELENCRREGSLDSFRESFPELFEEADTTTTVSARRMRYTSGTVTLARRQPAVISPMANGSALAARIDCAVKLTRISYKVGTVVVQAAIEAMTTTVKQAETYAEWRGAQNTMEQAAETMYQISVSDHPEYYQQVYKEAEQQYIRAQDRYDQKKKELQTRCTEEIVLAGLGRVAKTTGKVTEQLLGAVAEKAVQKGVETKLGKVAIKFGDDIAKFAQEKTKDKKLGKYLEAYAKELSGKKIVGNTAELVKSLANDKIVDAIKNGLGKMVGIDRDEKPLPEEEPPLEELPIPTPVPKDEEPFDPFEQPDDVEEEPPFDPFEQPDDVVEEPPFDPFEQPIDDGPVVIAVTPAKPQIDPSGYVYEAVRSNRVEGVMTTVYYKGADGTPVFWDAEEYGQENPLFTNRIGYYEWFVPSGEWQVVYEMEGYETYVTDWLPVPPPQTEVNVGIVSKEPPTARAYFHKNSVELIFSRYMRVEDVLNAAFTLNDDTGAQRTLTLYANNAEAAADRSGNMLASRFTATVSGGALQIGKSYSLAIPAGINSYAGVGTLPQNVEGSCTKGVKDIQAEDVLMLEAGGIVQIPIRVAAEGIPTGVVLNCTSSQRGIAQVLSVSPVSITGYCVVTVQTSRVGVIPLEITAENSCVKKTVSVQVVADESAVKDTGVSFLKVGNHPVDWVLIAG